jgi:arsenate reductase (thioredoxin)
VTDQPYNVLFLCTGNSARSIIAEAILDRIGAGRFRAFSAGSQPRGNVHPQTIALLQGLGYDIAGLRSKSWNELAGPGAPVLDFVFTVCDSAANEACPVWPGQPMTAHWGVPDPAQARGSPAEIELAFRQAYRMLNQRIQAFAGLPIRSFDPPSLRHRLEAIGRMERAAGRASE